MKRCMKKKTKPKKSYIGGDKKELLLMIPQNIKRRRMRIN